MKFTKIRLIGLDTIDLPIVNALPSDPYILKDADGLGPPVVDVTIAATLNTGGLYQGRRPQSRQPVLTIGLNPDHASGQSAGDLRSSLYGMLTPGYVDDVQLQIINDETVIATTTGYVSKLDISPFAKDPQVQLTMESLQPYFDGPTDLYVVPSGTKAAPELVNSGTAPTGFHMEATFTDAMSSWSLTDPNTGKKMEFDYDFVAGDLLAFDTRPGFRTITVTRDLLTTNIIYALTADSTWHMLYGGVNQFVTNSSAFDWGDVYYRPKYWGV